MQHKFNASLEDAFIWTHNKNGIYTANNGYSWMLARMNPVITSNSPPSWSWIWKLQLSEKIKFLFWLACHNSVPTLSMLNHRNIVHSAVCSRCGLHDETFLHCVRDCIHSKHSWQQAEFNQSDFFSNEDTINWIKNRVMAPYSFLFAATIWWAWRNRNMMCLCNENWLNAKLSFNIQGMVDTLKACDPSISYTTDEGQFIKWNHNNHSCVILNVDGSCLGSPIRAGYGGILRNDAGFFLSGFSGYIQNSSDILYAELYAIYKGLLLAKEMGITDFVCYSDSLHCINILNGPPMRFHAYVVLIQDIKELLEQGNVMVNYTLREVNQCADFFAKLGASSDVEFLWHELLR